MKKQMIKILAVVLAAGALMFAAPATSQATVVTSVLVSLNGGANTWCSTNLVCGNPIWNLGAGVDLFNGGFALVLTQTNATPFNFDTSDFSINVASPASPVITINGSLVFTDNNNILNQPNGIDPGGTTHQEAHEWSLPAVNSLGGLKLWVAYADNAHNNTCGDTSGNCLPDNPWSGSSNTTFLGAGTTTAPGSGCDIPGISTCFDAGAIRIEALPAQTPETSTLVLLGVGLVGIAAFTRRKARSNA